MIEATPVSKALRIIQREWGTLSIWIRRIYIEFRNGVMEFIGKTK